jgi:hypothetical protein
MSLISIENILEPFTNKVHLITIILVVFVFAILRLQGGGFSISTDIEPPRLYKKPTATRSIPAAATMRKETPRDRQKAEFLDQMIAEGDAEVQAYRKTQKKAAPNNERGLSDIEKSLGLK